MSEDEAVAVMALVRAVAGSSEATFWRRLVVAACVPFLKLARERWLWSHRTEMADEARALIAQSEEWLKGEGMISASFRDGVLTDDAQGGRGAGDGD